MPYDYMNELKKVKSYYEGDPLQKRFSALITGETNAGKTYLLRTARKPIHIDSFDPGGTKCLRDLIEKGEVIADTQWESDDPLKPNKFAEWMKTVDLRMRLNYFDHFGTYCIDSATTFGDAIMNYQLNSRGQAGEAPNWGKDYMPQKTMMVNYIKKLMSIPCDFILTGHLRAIEDKISVDLKTGITRKNIKYRFYTTGQAVVTIPLLFDEIYVLIAEESPRGLKRKMLIDSSGTYIARSRLKANSKLSSVEEPNIKGLLRKAGLKWDDKPPLKID